MKTTAEKLRAALPYVTGSGAVRAHIEKPWASITFTGTRHLIDLRFEGAEAVEAGEKLIAELADYEFAIPGQLVADAGVIEIEHRILPSPRLDCTCDILLLEDA